MKKKLHEYRYTAAILLVLLLVIAALEIHLRSTERSVNQEIRVEIKGITTPKKTFNAPEKQPQVVEIRLPETDLPQRPKIEKPLTPSDFGLLQTRLLVKDSLVRMPITLRISSRKRNLDPNFLSTALGLSKDEKIFISVESLNPPQVLARKEVPMTSKLYQGYNTRVIFPFSKDTRHIAIFVCSDTQSSGSCREKQMLNLKQANLSSRSRKGNTFFFNYGMLIGNRLYMLDYSKGEQMYFGLKEYFKSLSSNKKTITSFQKKLLEAVVKINYKVQSPGAHLMGSGVYIYLVEDKQTTQ